MSRLLPSIAKRGLPAKVNRNVSTPSVSRSGATRALARCQWMTSTLASRHVSTSFPSLSQQSSSAVSSSNDSDTQPRESMEYDVVIVGAGPSGLSAAIRLKQLKPDISVCVVEKGSEVGAHIFSGNCFETRALDELFPDWKERQAPLHTPAKEDVFSILLSSKRSITIPNFVLPKSFHNDGNYIISLSQFVRWLGQQAEGLGVEIYPGFAASEILLEQHPSESTPRVVGIATADVGIGKDGNRKDSFARGIELKGKQTLFAEGCRGSLTKQLFEIFDLRRNCSHQTFGLGVKELWSVPSSHPHFKPGFIRHTVGYPLDGHTYGGSWMYHMKNPDDDSTGFISLGYVVALDYPNPWLSPYQEFQRWKHHPSVKKYLEGGEVISYGARTLNEGGFQSIPRLTFAGGALVGDTAGFLNVPKIKGTHTAMKTGMLAAEALVADCFQEDKSAIEATSYKSLFESSWVYQELYSVRNVRPSFRWGLWLGLALSGMEMIFFRGKLPFTLSHHKPDHLCLKSADAVPKIDYPKPDGKISFDLLTNLALSGTDHNQDQPAHLRLKDKSVPETVNWAKYRGPESRFCPARVYEYIPDAVTGNSHLHINAQNCLHCKACDIKDPTQNINWTVPEGGGGPAYTQM